MGGDWYSFHIFMLWKKDHFLLVKWDNLGSASCQSIGGWGAPCEYDSFVLRCPGRRKYDLRYFVWSSILCQAHVAGEVKATLISPFAGRITDYYKVLHSFSIFWKIYSLFTCFQKRIRKGGRTTIPQSKTLASVVLKVQKKNCLRLLIRTLDIYNYMKKNGYATVVMGARFYALFNALS